MVLFNDVAYLPTSNGGILSVLDTLDPLEDHDHLYDDVLFEATDAFDLDY